MKTVMKKMFSLMLVAVLLVGVMPFQAFADGAPYYQIISPGEGNKLLESVGDLEVRAYEQSEFPIPSGYTFDYATKNGNPTTFPVELNDGDVLLLLVNPTPVETCTTCGQVKHEGLCEGQCPECLQLNSHASTCPTLPCSVSGCTYGNGHSGEHSVPCDDADCTLKLGHSGDHSYPCTKDSGCKSTVGHYSDCYTNCTGSSSCKTAYHKDGCESQNVCKTCGKTGHYEKNCPDTICPYCKASMANKKHEDGCLTLCDGKRDCPNEAYSGSDHHNAGCQYAYCNEPGCTKKDGHSGEHTGSPCEDENCSFSLGHDGKHSYQCPNEGCDKAINHDGLCSNEYEGGPSKVKVHVNIYNADTYKYTKELVVYTDKSGTAIHDSITTHKALIQAELDAQYPGYTWESGHIYKDVKGTKAVSTTENVGEGVTVYINAYSNENFVFIMVHNSRSMSYIDLIPLHGVKFGDTVTKSEVKKAVSAKYNITSLSMYSEQAWEDYVAGKTVKSVDSIKITRGESDLFFIDVRISGTAKSSSGSSSGAAADSSNPKTGDMIFTPVVVMGTSVACLAVLFYLNKKRAY